MKMATNKLSNLSHGLPPVLPDIGKELEEYLVRPDKLPMHNDKHDFKFWPRSTNLRSLYSANIAPVITTLKVNRDPTTGRLIDFKEVVIEGIGYTAKNSYSLSRMPDKVTEDIRGKHTNNPFWPGGFEQTEQEDVTCDGEDFTNNLLTIAPGLSRGIDFTSTTFNQKQNGVSPSDVFADASGSCLFVAEGHSVDKSEEKKVLDASVDAEIEFMLQNMPIPVLRLKTKEKEATFVVQKMDWAEMLDSTKPVPDFKKNITTEALVHSFEYDPFQQQAMLKLENHKHVFVAAHTSAGKTAVAEHAISLSFSHNSKTVYTSPIKALSNQKYRDFKEQFKDVGLITGDFQINQNAGCLVMTTEILRSMLFKGSSVIRELEFVIFDEVHYFNDRDRGHVWEETLILLPDNVCIVMLSATVPNALQFANWIGSIKKRKVYVVTTAKRPVPLQHYLFVPVKGKGTNIFMIKDADGPFIKENYSEVKELYNSISKSKSEYKVPSAAAREKIEEQELFILLDYLQKSDEPYIEEKIPKYVQNMVKDFGKKKGPYVPDPNKLPVIYFAFSRKKCDKLSYAMSKRDLTTAKEKSYIIRFFNKHVKNLKEEDQNLKQVRSMKRLLENGIGVHHSGVLPILREIVEMLFQEQRIKVLFSTETFAMGVNMPARTVVFDSVEKYDGVIRRSLNPAEYIQMAGRAGRRGKDKTGIVIIMYRGHTPPDEHELKQMMTGSPDHLESQFRLTYSVILTMLKLDGWDVEQMLWRSFKDCRSMENRKARETKLNDLKSAFENESKDMKSKVCSDLETFYDVANEFIQHWNAHANHIFNNENVKKHIMKPGRIVIITYKHHINKLALLLQMKPNEYKVLVLCDCEQEENEEQTKELSAQFENATSENLWYAIMSFLDQKIFVPKERRAHTVLSISPSCVMDITHYFLKVETNLVIQNWEQRQLPRFKNDKPGPTTMTAIDTLYEKSVECNKELNSHILPLTELKLNELDDVECIHNLMHMRKTASVVASNVVSFVPDFKSLFHDVFKMKRKKEEIKNLEYILSAESLKTYPEYRSQLMVLQALGYVDSEHKTKTKGNAASNMSTNELILTELIFSDKLSSYEPAEIVALLSSLVFTGRVIEDKEGEDQLSSGLKKGKEMMLSIWKEISAVEKNCGIYDQLPEPNFGLVKVVYEWACGEPFSSIMEIEKDVQEGIIVRCIQQIYDILRDIKFVVVTYAGDTVLKEKLDEAADKIKRDIVFAQSLYTQE